MDPALTYKPHIDYVVNRCTTRLNALRSVAGTDWGADRATLLTLYTTWIRPILEYGCQAFGTASDSHLRLLDRVQASALRVVLGARRNADVAAMHAECAIDFLALRRIKMAARLYARLMRSSPMDSNVQEWISWLSSARPKPLRLSKIPQKAYTRPPLSFTPYHLLFVAASYASLPSLDRSVEHLFHPPIETFPHHDDDDKPNWPRLTQDDDNSRRYACDLIKATQGKSPEGLICFTDGSVRKGGAGCGSIVTYKGNRVASCSSPLTPSANSAFSELSAIYYLTRFLLLHRNSHTPSITIFTDSQTAVLAVRLGITPPETYWAITSLIRKNIRNLRDSRTQVIVDWIPKRSANPLHSEADALARTAASRTFYPNQSRDPPTPYALIHLHIAITLSTQSEIWFTTSKKSSFLRRISGGKVPVPTNKLLTKVGAPRRVVIAFSRLRIGNPTTNATLFYAGHLDSPSCDHCISVKDSATHRLLECPAYHTHRQPLISFVETLALPFSLETIIGFHKIPNDKLIEALSILFNYLWNSRLANLFCLKLRPTALPYVN